MSQVARVHTREDLAVICKAKRGRTSHSTLGDFVTKSRLFPIQDREGRADDALLEDRGTPPSLRFLLSLRSVSFKLQSCRSLAAVPAIWQENS